jgi:hypothetical protein
MGWGTGEGRVAPEKMSSSHPLSFSPEKRKKGWRINETSTNLRKQVYHGVEND